MLSKSRMIASNFPSKQGSGNSSVIDGNVGPGAVDVVVNSLGAPVTNNIIRSLEQKYQCLNVANIALP